jgi:hypothetical protein
MRVLKQYGSGFALLLAASVVAQVFCPLGLLAVVAPVGPPTSHSGCHGSVPQEHSSPTPSETCCALAPVARPSPLTRDILPTLLIVQWASIDAPVVLPISRQPAATIRTRYYSPPGLIVRRI